MLMLLFFFFFWLYCPFEVLKKLVDVDSPAIVDVRLFLVVHACLSCCLLLSFVYYVVFVVVVVVVCKKVVGGFFLFLLSFVDVVFTW